MNLIMLIKYLILVGLLFYLLVTLVNYFNLTKDQSGIFKHNIECITNEQNNILVYVFMLIFSLIALSIVTFLIIVSY